MKILYVHELYPPETVGGGETYSETIVQNLIKNNIDVTVLAGTSGKTRLDKRKGVSVYRINTFPSRYTFNIRAYRHINELIKKVKPDLIHTNAFNASMPAYFSGKKNNIPVVVNLHFLFQNNYYRYFNPITSTLFYLMERFNLMFNYDKIIALDYNIYRKLKSMKKKNIEFIPHMINTELFKPSKKPKNFTIGTAITPGASKRNDLFFDLAKELSDTGIKFVAVGSSTSDMKRKFKKYGIKYLGRFSHDKMPDFYNNIHLYFGQGMAAKEAMSCGTPAILNENVKRLVEYHHFEIKDKVMLVGNPTKIIRKLYVDKKYWNSLSIRSRRFIKQNYSEKIILPKIINVYKKLI